MVMGAHNDSSTFTTVRQRSAGIVALFALFLHIAVPTLYDLAPPAVKGLMQVTICAGGEAKQVLIDESGKPVKQVPADNHNCHSCMSHCGVLALTATAALAPHLFAPAVFGPISSLPRGYYDTTEQARAPPL
tara:strand:+ start:663 stop:1058 length:396 start_codon:yes stop_codon:yes gene_type:complete